MYLYLYIYISIYLYIKEEDLLPGGECLVAVEGRGRRLRASLLRPLLRPFPGLLSVGACFTRSGGLFARLAERSLLLPSLGLDLCKFGLHGRLPDGCSLCARVCESVRECVSVCESV